VNHQRFSLKVNGALVNGTPLMSFDKSIIIRQKKTSGGQIIKL
jgi:hypothetical protein